jgi:hypothetical protein
MANYPHLDRMVAEKRKINENVTKVPSLGLHEGEALDDVRQQQKAVEIVHRRWIQSAVSLRASRESAEEQIEELRGQIEDINRAINTFRAACGVDESEVWYGYDAPFDDESTVAR